MNLFESLVNHQKSGRAVALVTVISTDLSTPRDAGSRMLVFPDGSIEGTVGGGIGEAKAIEEAKAALKSGETRKIKLKLTPQGLDALCGGEAELFIEVFLPAERLLILGGGHIGEKLARICEVIALPYIIADDREEFANRKRFPGALDIYAGDYEKLFDSVNIDEKTYLVIVTRGHSHDTVCLQKALKTRAAYIGMIGSRTKVAAVLEKLEREGEKVKSDPRVYTPIGLQIGDKTPGEIAISILAEILLLKSGGELRHMREIIQKNEVKI